MKSLLVAATAMLGLAAGANAADLPFKAPPPAAPVAANWPGWYAGFNAGGDWGSSQASSTIGTSTTPIFLIPIEVAAVNGLTGPTSFNTSGFTGGVQGGYNYQMGRWLVGLESEFDYFRSAGSTGVTGLVTGAPTAFTASVSTDWLFTLRPRVGIVADNWLLYATGGLALTDIHASWAFAQPVLVGPVSVSSSTSSLRVGWAAGAGVETALAGRYTLGLEYLHVDFGTVTTSGVIVVGGVGPLTNPVSQSASLTADIVRLRLGKLF